MEKVTLSKTELLGRVKKNRSAHEELYKQAIEGYRRKVADTLTSLKKMADANQDVDFHVLFQLSKPESHIKEYDRVISMLTHHTKDEVELTNVDFGRYHEDDWEWKERWLMSNSAYTGVAKR